MKMSKEVVDKRRKEIMQIIQTEKEVSVEQLVEKFKVNPLTIRRDLQYWEDKGAVERFYGGAKLIQNYVDNNEKYNNEAYKHAIAKYAAQFIEDNDTVFINTSSTALLVLNYIKAKNVTVITNNGRAIFSNYGNNVTVVLTGGELRTPKEAMVGDFALNNINKVKANKVFLGCSGFDIDTGMMTAILPEVSINEAMIRQGTGEIFLLADATKIGAIHQFIVAKPTSFDYLISDDRLEDEIYNEIINRGISAMRLAPYINFNASHKHNIQ